MKIDLNNKTQQFVGLLNFGSIFAREPGQAHQVIPIVSQRRWTFLFCSDGAAEIFLQHFCRTCLAVQQQNNPF